MTDYICFWINRDAWF